MYQKVKFYTLADFVHVELKAEKERGTIYLFFFSVRMPNVTV